LGGEHTTHHQRLHNKKKKNKGERAFYIHCVKASFWGGKKSKVRVPETKRMPERQLCR